MQHDVTAAITRRSPDRSSVRFRINARGTPRVRAHHKRRIYEDLLADTPHAETAELRAVACHDTGKWSIEAAWKEEVETASQAAEPVEVADGREFETREQAEQHIDDAEQELRIEAARTFFTMGECVGCEAVVPVLGDYIPYAPAGELFCNECLRDDPWETPAGAIVRR